MANEFKLSFTAAEIDEKLRKVDTLGGGTQSDWNQTDSSAADFIKNKPFGDMPTVILEEQELQYDAEAQGCVGVASAPIDAGDLLIIVYDGVSYECTATYLPQAGGLFFGNLSLTGIDINTGEPFLGMYQDGMIYTLDMDDTENHIVKITAADAIKIPEKYYDCAAVFFINGGKYVYTDFMCTTKATHEDVANVAKKKPIILSLMNAEFSTVRTVSIIEDYAELITETFSFYTAEYTEPTT